MEVYTVILIRFEDVVLELFGHTHGERVDTSGNGNVFDILPVFGRRFKQFRVSGSVNKIHEMIAPFHRWLKEELFKVDVLRIIEQRCSDMHNVIEIMVFERVVPSSRFRIIRDNRE